MSIVPFHLEYSSPSYLKLVSFFGKLSNVHTGKRTRPYAPFDNLSARMLKLSTAGTAGRSISGANPCLYMVVPRAAQHES